jgi:signal transduction histidine kinase/ActR/RegA family two-component response regulator/sensor domain CHASE-containing protein
VPIIAAVVAILLGVFAVWTWATGQAALNQIRPDYAPVQPNAAISFVLIGAALIAARRGYSRAALILAVAFSSLAGLVFLQHLFNVDFHIDQLLMTAEHDTPYPGRMAANTCFAFVLTGAAIAILRRAQLVGALLGSVVFSIGAVALAGYLFGVPTAFAWGRSTHMALLSSIGVTLVGAALMSFAFEEHRATRLSRRAWGPLLLGLNAALFGVFFSQALRMQEHDQIRRTILATVRGEAGEIEARFGSMVDALTRLSTYGAAAGWSSREEWRTDARLTVGAFPGFESMEWIDEDFTPRIVAMRSDQARLVAESDANKRLLASALELARTSKYPLIAAPFRFADGETAFRVIVPVARSNHGIDAYVASVFSVAQTFGELPARLSPGYATELLSNDRMVFHEGPDDEEMADDWMRELPLAVSGAMPWTLRVIPSEKFIDGQHSGLPVLALSASLLIALLLGLTVRFAALNAERAEHFETAVQERTADLEEANKRLEWENAERRRTSDTLRRTQDVSRVLSAELSLANVVQTVTDAASALTGAEGGAFFYSSGATAGATYSASVVSGLRPEVFRDVSPARYPELFDATFRDRQVARCEDLTTDARFLASDADGSASLPPGIVSYLAVPVTARSGEIWGGLCFAHSKRTVFCEREEEIACGLASQASIAMENARLYQAERGSRSEAQKANRAKDRFLAVLGHELRNPLGSIRNAFEVMTMRPDDDALRTRMQSIARRQIRNLTRLVDDLLDISRIERGKVALQPERIDLGALVREHVESERGRAAASGLNLEMDIAKEPVWVDGDATRLTQVIGNLLANAVKFTDPGQSIRVSVEAEDGEAVLRVKDTGAGIATENLEYIFEPFAQADESLDRASGGLGLGLPILKGLVEAHRGTVTAHSEGLGHGSEFVVRLPRKAAATPRAQRPTREPSQPTWRILVIDDHSDSAEGLSELLTLYGHHVDVANDGAQGLRKAQDLRPEIVICDIGLPEMDGYEVARRMRADPRTASIRLFALTGYGDEHAAKRAEEAGFDFHLTKPVDVALLRQLLASGAQTAHPATG